MSFSLLPTKQLFSRQRSLPQGCVSLRWPDSRESIQAVRANRLILSTRFGVPELTPLFFANRASGALKNYESQF